MLEEINKIIEKNLPQEVGKVLQERLTVAESESLELKDLKENFKAQTKNYGECLERLENLRGKESEITAREKNVVTQEKELSKRENELAKTLAELKAAEAEKRAEGIKEIVGLVFKSPVYRRQTSDYKSYTPIYNNNGQSEIKETGTNSNETISEE